jgi:arylsulfatase
LQEAGYTTALVGKTHLYYDFSPTPQEVQRTGFDILELHDGVSKTDKHSAYAKWYKENDPKPQKYYRATAQSQLKEGQQVPKGTNPYRALIKAQYSDTAWSGLKTCEYIEQFKDSDEPFFIFTSFWKPHSPFEVHKPYDAMYSDIDIPLPLQKLVLRGRPLVYSRDRQKLQWIYRSYYGTVTHIDDEVAHILKTFEKTGQAENTIVIFTSDHGD